MRVGPRGIRRLGVVLALGTVLGCADAPPEAPEPIRPVKTITVGEERASGRREYPGTLSPAVDALLGFEVPGRIVAFPVTEGQAVAEGTLLARLDARDYEAKLAAARAGTRKAEADLARALAVRKADAGAISMAMIDLYRRSVDVARAEQTVAEKALDDATLRAPFAGRVARKLVDDFANVQAKEPVVNLQDESFIHARVDLPERDLAGTRPGADGREAATARFAPMVSMPSHSDRAYPAEIWELATTADPATRTFRLTLRFPAPEGVVLLPGMTGTVSLAIGGARGAGEVFRVPATAVVTGADRTPFVWIVEPETMVARQRAVRLGRVVSDQIEILEGLRAGDTIATAGVHQLRDGMRVRRLES